MKKERNGLPEWDVSDIDRVAMFPKDCRYYNGGAVAPKWLQKLWGESDKEHQKYWKFKIKE